MGAARARRGAAAVRLLQPADLPLGSLLPSPDRAPDPLVQPHRRRGAVRLRARIRTRLWFRFVLLGPDPAAGQPAPVHADRADLPRVDLGPEHVARPAQAAHPPALLLAGDPDAVRRGHDLPAEVLVRPR